MPKKLKLTSCRRCLLYGAGRYERRENKSIEIDRRGFVVSDTSHASFYYICGHCYGSQWLSDVKSIADLEVEE